MPFESFRFIHATALRLDVPLALANDCPEDTREIIEDATLITFHNIVERCLEYNVDFLLLTGNSFNESDSSLRARLALQRGLNRLNANGIRTFVLPGKTDPLSAWRDIPDLGNHVTIFHGTDDEPVAVIRDDRVIASVTAGPISRFRSHPQNRPESAAHWQIGLCLPGEQDRETVFEETNVSQTVDYLALGGQQPRCEIRSEHRIAHHPGCAQPLSASEPGPHGCTMVEVQPDGTIKSSFLQVAAVRWESAGFDVTEEMTADQLQQNLREKLQQKTPDTAEQVRFVDCRLLGQKVLSGFLSEETEIKKLVESLEQISFSNSSVRMVINLRVIDEKANVKSEPCCPSLATDYSTALSEQIADYSEFLSHSQGELESRRLQTHFSLLLKSSIDQENVVITAREFGQEWFGMNVAEDDHS
jgi:DNA repair protein SbcD/Mre11